MLTANAGKAWVGLRDAEFGDAEFRVAEFRDAEFRAAEFWDAEFADAEFWDADREMGKSELKGLVAEEARARFGVCVSAQCRSARVLCRKHTTHHEHGSPKEAGEIARGWGL